jgi:hypothetical protein
MLPLGGQGSKADCPANTNLGSRFAISAGATTKKFPIQCTGSVICDVKIAIFISNLRPEL